MLMNDFKKAQWAADGDTLQLSFDFNKVNKHKRLVSGFATLDNEDTQGDIVTAEASLKAFENARGNLREMHKKDSAVGKIVSFKEEKFTDTDGKTYTGIFVTARVSEGAQDTWLKVLDGTLTGFSISGSIIDSTPEINKSTNKPVRKINKYDLTELSLVDNPANQLANVFHIQKNADGTVDEITGMAAEQEIYNVFFCQDDSIFIDKQEDIYDCPVCEKSMTNIDFVEDGPNRAEKVKGVMTKYLSRIASEGGVDVKTKNKEEFKKAVEVPGEPVAETPPAPVLAELEEKERVVEVLDESDELSKKIDNLSQTITERLEKTHGETSTELEEIRSQIESLNKSFSDVEERLTKLDEGLHTAKSRISGFEKSLDAVNRGVALKKSVDSEPGSTETVEEESFWNGAFSVKGITG